MSKGLYLICNVSLYMAFAGFLVIVFFDGTEMIATLPIFAIVSFLIGTLSGRGFMRYIPVVLAGACFFIVPLTVSNILVLIPPIIYLAIMPMHHSIHHFEFARRFKLFLKVYLAFIFTVLLVGIGVDNLTAKLEISALPFGITFILCSIILLRMLRHDDNIRKEVRFKALNLLSVVIVLAITIVLSSRAFLGFASSVLSFAYFDAILPAISIVGGWLAEVIRLIHIPLDRVMENIAPDPLQDIIRPTSADLRNPALGRNLLVNTIFAALGAIVAFIVFLHVKKLISIFVRKAHTKLSYVAPIGNAPSKTRKPLPKGHTSNRRAEADNQVRTVYRKFLVFCRENGIMIQPHLTSQDIENQAAEKFCVPESKQLRNVYSKARYSGERVSSADVKNARILQRKIRKERV